MSTWKEYYSKPGNREKHLKQKYESDRKRKQFLYDFVNQIKDVPCKDCGIKYPSYVMDLDHVSDDKIDSVSRLISNIKSIKQVKEEVLKCEVVCSNCHRIRTYNRRTKAS